MVLERGIGMCEVSIIYRCNEGSTGTPLTVLKVLPFLESAKIEGNITRDLVRVRAKVRKEWDFPELKTFLELLSLYIRFKEGLITLPEEEAAKTLQDCLKTVLKKVKISGFNIDRLSKKIKEAIINIRDIKPVDNSPPDDEYDLEPTSHKKPTSHK